MMLLVIRRHTGQTSAGGPGRVRTPASAVGGKPTFLRVAPAPTHERGARANGLSIAGGRRSFDTACALLRCRRPWSGGPRRRPTPSLRSHWRRSPPTPSQRAPAGHRRWLEGSSSQLVSKRPPRPPNLSEGRMMGRTHQGTRNRAPRSDRSIVAMPLGQAAHRPPSGPCRIRSGWPQRSKAGKQLRHSNFR